MACISLLVLTLETLRGTTAAAGLAAAADCPLMPKVDSTGDDIGVAEGVAVDVGEAVA